MIYFVPILNILYLYIHLSVLLHKNLSIKKIKSDQKWKGARQNSKGGNMNKAQELEVIQSGRIQYKHAEIQETSLQFIGSTAILLSKIRLTAIVGGNEVINPFTVTEVYVHQNDAWKLGSLSFSKLLGP
jgi:hypothetical protein